MLDKAEQQQQQQQEHVLPKDAVAGAGAPPVETAAELEHLVGSQYSQQQLRQKLSTLDKAVGKVWEALPHNALLLVATGQGDIPDVCRQQELKIRCVVRGCWYKDIRMCLVWVLVISSFGAWLQVGHLALMLCCKAAHTRHHQRQSCWMLHHGQGMCCSKVPVLSY